MRQRMIVCILLFTAFLLLCGFDKEQKKVYDNADLLTDEQEINLQARVVEIGEALRLDIALVTTDNTNGIDSKQYADDFYDANGFGFEGKKGSGILCLLDMDNREITTSALGSAKDRLDDAKQEKIRQLMLPAMKQQEYYSAFVLFLDNIEKYEAYAPSVMASNNIVVSTIKNNSGKMLLIEFIISLVISGIIVAIMVSKSHTEVTTDGHTYLRNNGINMEKRSDLFTHTTVVERRIEKNTDASSGGTNSSSCSSDHSHGGGSTKF